MAFKLEPQPGDRRRASHAAAAADDGTFRISAEPVVKNGGGAEVTTAGQTDDALPTSYGSPTLYLMARDPHSLFAYWEIDWADAFRDQRPRDRKVHLRVSRGDATEETTLEIEPMAGSCYVDVSHGGESYTAEIGYYEPAGIWNSVAVSMPAETPPETVEPAEPPDFATVPFHLSFQRMIDLFRVSKHENESLTAMLADLRERARSEVASPTLTAEEREIVRAIDDAVAQALPPGRSSTGETPDLWVQQNLQRILGFGARTTSPDGGFGAPGGSSWAS